MARYIDADKLKELIKSFTGMFTDDSFMVDLFAVLRAIDNAETANVAPIADTVKKMQERLRFEIINKPSEFRADQGTVDFLNGSAHKQLEVLEIVDQIAKEILEGREAQRVEN